MIIFYGGSLLTMLPPPPGGDHSSGEKKQVWIKTRGLTCADCAFILIEGPNNWRVGLELGRNVFVPCSTPEGASIYIYIFPELCVPPRGRRNSCVAMRYGASVLVSGPSGPVVIIAGSLKVFSGWAICDFCASTVVHHGTHTGPQNYLASLEAYAHPLVATASSWRRDLG